MNRRALLELLLAATITCCAYYLCLYVPRHARAGEPVIALANYFLTYAPIERANQRAYILPDSVAVWDTPAEIRAGIGTLKSGEEVRVLGHFRDWAHVRGFDDRDGWISADGLMNFETHDAEQRLLSAVAEMPTQAAGQPTGIENLHIEPSRTAAVVTELTPDRGLLIFGRKLVPRSAGSKTSNGAPASPARLEPWYLVREGSHAGWILGHRVQLTVPKSISSYAQDTNLVAWMPLNSVRDNGSLVPQYVVAERVGNEACDFTKIEVLTWWKRKQTYAVAFRKGDLQGYFPIVVTHEGSVPQFRLRLEDKDGNKYQAIYGLYDTLTHLIGTANVWASDAEPEPPSSPVQGARPVRRVLPVSFALRSRAGN